VQSEFKVLKGLKGRQVQQEHKGRQEFKVLKVLKAL
jgi:hypothetical protein